MIYLDYYKIQNEKLIRQNVFLNNENHFLISTGCFHSSKNKTKKKKNGP